MAEKRILFENGSELLRADFHLHTNSDKTFSYEGAEDEYIKACVML